jgi:murein DD-endopeptidase MepM/ murein hydrolase activator NlpD
MFWAKYPRLRTLLVATALIAAVAILVARISRTSNHRPMIIRTRSAAPEASQAATLPRELHDNFAEAQPTAQPTAQSTPTAEGSSSPIVVGEPSPSPSDLIIPLAGVRPDQLRDTFSEARAGGRVHDAIDIPAPHGTPVLAAADGRIVKLFQSALGGTTVYQLSTDGKFVYYYAHLDRYADGLSEGHLARQGETIAYVGDTGNAGAGNYHLHFSIAVISNPKDFWHGQNINPYPLLRK